ncbi:class I SAM-dependent methyltransferase [Candidatus Woesearchaeota archaeon]|nr:class I SAM-dependent methyltransferase [Candidatus Woesearchaeota archaeon]
MKSTGFKSVAKVYDEVIGAMDYKEWTKDLLSLIKKHKNIGKKTKILDIGCGTGGHIEFLEKEFYCVGVDSSKEMIEAAKKKVKSKVFVHDMRKIDLDENFDVILCIYDVINNLPSKNDVKKAFGAVNKNLKKEGVFVFDIITKKAMKGMNDFQIQAGHTGKNSFIWENKYEEGIWEWTFTVFSPKPDGSYKKQVETHKEYYYSVDDLKKILKDCGFEFVEAVDAYTLEKPNDDSDRINIVTKNNSVL